MYIILEKYINKLVTQKNDHNHRNKKCIKDKNYLRDL